MKYLCLSGGGSEMAAIAGAVSSLLTKEGYRPDVVTGVSAGAGVALPAVMGFHSLLKELTTSANAEKVFSDVPLTKRGVPTLTALWRLITSKPSIGSMGEYRRAYSSIITQDVFNEYKEMRSMLKAPRVGVLVVEVPCSALRMVYADSCSYEQWIDAVVGSASVPLFAPPSGSSLMMDGGVRVHCPSYYHTAICQCEDMTEMVEVYAREPLENGKYLLPKTNSIDNSFESLKWYIETVSTQVSLMGESYVKLYCETRGIKHISIFTGTNMRGMFDFDADRLDMAYWAGVSAVSKYYVGK